MMYRGEFTGAEGGAKETCIVKSDAERDKALDEGYRLTPDPDQDPEADKKKKK